VALSQQAEITRLPINIKYIYKYIK